MPAHHYRITVDTVDLPPQQAGEGGLQSLSFFAGGSCDVFASAARMRDQLQLSACKAAQLALGLNLLREVIFEHSDQELFAQFHQPMRELLSSIDRGLPSLHT